MQGFTRVILPLSRVSFMRSMVTLSAVVLGLFALFFRRKRAPARKLEQEGV